MLCLYRSKPLIWQWLSWSNSAFCLFRNMEKRYKPAASILQGNTLAGWVFLPALSPAKPAFGRCCPHLHFPMDIQLQHPHPRAVTSSSPFEGCYQRVTTITQHTKRTVSCSERVQSMQEEGRRRCQAAAPDSI